MPITCGSVGDIISVSLLIKDLVKCLDESRGSSAEYQTVVRELWSLDRALLEVELLLRSCKQSAELRDLGETPRQHCGSVAAYTLPELLLPTLLRPR